jgi:hypothetical protein
MVSRLSGCGFCTDDEALVLNVGTTVCYICNSCSYVLTCATLLVHTTSTNLTFTRPSARRSLVLMHLFST